MGRPIKFEVVNEENVRKELERKGPELAAAMDGVIKKGALRVANRIVRTLQKGGRSGRTYPRGDGKTHQASAPGEPPKSDTGFLASQVKPTPTRKDGFVIGASVVVSANYAGFLEFGTSRMDKRPYVRPAIALETPAIRNEAKKAIKRVL